MGIRRLRISMGLRGSINMRSKQPNVRLTGSIDSHPKLALTMTAVLFSFLPQDDLLVVRRSVTLFKMSIR